MSSEKNRITKADLKKIFCIASNFEEAVSGQKRFKRKYETAYGVF